MNLHNIFSVPLFELEYTNDLNPIIEGINKIKHRPGVKKSNNHGYQSTSDLHMCDFMEPLMRWICIESGEAFEAIGNPRESVSIESCWFNINNSLNNHNQMHNHSGVLSGVIYLEAPEGSGNINFMNLAMNQMWAGHLGSSHRNQYNAFHFSVTPKPGMMYLFPSYLYHSVDANHKEVERMSISFNLL